jgi:hypothetical protein
MLDYAQRSSERIESGMSGLGVATAGSLLQQLRRHRVRPQVLADGRGTMSCGLALRCAAGQYLDSTTVAAELNGRLADALASGIPVTLSLTDFEPRFAVESSLEAFCKAVKGATRDSRHAGDLLGVSVRSHILPIQAFLVICSILGRGPRYVMLDSLQMQDHADRRVQSMTDANWLELRHHRKGVVSAQAVYSECVRSRCPLLADEKTSSVLPALTVPVPANSSWLPLEIFLPDYSDGNGHLDIPVLRDALHACLDIAENLSPLLAQSCNAQRRDLQMNNRIALLVSGIGDLVLERKLDPCEIRSLRWVERIVTAIQNELWEYSGALAQKNDTLPSLLQNDASNAWQSVEHLQEWSLRWRQALQTQAVRHRNLLVLSPYSVLPRHKKSSSKFIDLLPVLAHADAISFFGMPNISNWSIQEFSSFHRRAWTVIMRESRRTRIAVGP